MNRLLVNRIESRNIAYDDDDDDQENIKRNDFGQDKLQSYS